MWAKYSLCGLNLLYKNLSQIELTFLRISASFSLKTEDFLLQYQLRMTFTYMSVYPQSYIVTLVEIIEEFSKFQIPLTLHMTSSRQKMSLLNTIYSFVELSIMLPFSIIHELLKQAKSPYISVKLYSRFIPYTPQVVDIYTSSDVLQLEQ